MALLWDVEVRDRSLRGLGRESERLGQGRMRMDRESDIRRISAHLDRERGLRNEIAGVDADDPGAEQAMRAGVEQQLRETLAAAECQRPRAGCPRKRSL